MSADVALLALRARADLVEDILNRTDHGTGLHILAHECQRAYEYTIAQLAGGVPVTDVLAASRLASLAILPRSATAFLAFLDIITVLSGDRVPEPQVGS